MSLPPEEEEKFNAALDKYTKKQDTPLSKFFFYFGVALFIFVGIAHYTNNMHWVEALGGPLAIFLGCSVIYWTSREYKKGAITVGNSSVASAATFKRDRNPILFFFFFVLYMFSASLLIYAGIMYSFN